MGQLPARSQVTVERRAIERSPSPEAKRSLLRRVPLAVIFRRVLSCMQTSRNYEGIEVVRLLGRPAVRDRRSRAARPWRTVASSPGFWMSSFFGIAVWFSSLAALWMSRGWMGLFVSGQLLSAATYLWRGLGRRIPNRVPLSEEGD